jgi:uncharacterized membrane protein
VVEHVAKRASNTGTALTRAAALWFLTAVAGQWVFVYYIAAFYGPTLVSGEFELWDRNRNMTDGYLAGDIVGNLFFAAHVFLAAVLTFGGALQFVPQLRQRALAFHRWNGRIFVVAAFAAGLNGLYLEWVRGTGLRAPTGTPSAIAITLNAALILTFAALAWRAVRSKDIAAHQRWATRLFLVVNGTWFMRVGMRAWTVLTDGAFDGLNFFSFWSFAAYLLPLAIYELYLRAKAAAAPAQYALAGSLVVLTLIMAVGTVATFFKNWRPLLLG